MFLYRLNRVDRLTFLRMAKRMALTDDGMIDAEEEAMLATMAAEMGLSLHVTDNQREHPKRENDVTLEREFRLEELDGKFRDNISKNICLVELIGVGYVNRNFNAAQSEFIKDVAKSFEAPPDHVKKLDDWVASMIDLAIKGDQLIQT